MSTYWRVLYFSFESAVYPRRSPKLAFRFATFLPCARAHPTFIIPPDAWFAFRFERGT